MAPEERVVKILRLVRIISTLGTLKPSKVGSAPKVWVTAIKVSALRIVVSQTKP